jgi:hypothetical protein
LRAVRKVGVGDFLQHVFGESAGLTFVGVYGHG